MADLRISDLVTASQLKNDDYYEISQSESGTRVSYKATLLAIAVQIATMVDFTSDLNTTSKKITGAINELKQLISLIPQFSIEVVEELPTEDISDTTIYLVPAEDPEVGNYYEEYIHVNNTWELVGTTAVDLSAYYTKLEVDGLLATKANTADVTAALALKENKSDMPTDVRTIIKDCKTPKNATITNGIAQFECIEENLVKALKVSMSPIQDLHGYSNPWAGGAGKNKLPFDIAEIISNNQGGTWSGNIYTYRGITFTPDSEGKWKATGTATEATFIRVGKFKPSSGSYLINGITGGSGTTYRIIYKVGGGSSQNMYDGDSNIITVDGDTEILFDLYVSANYTADITFEPMIRLSSVADSTFAPYSNVCPISGRTEASVTRTAGEDVETHTHQYGQTVYGGEDDFVDGGATSEWGYIKLSDMPSSKWNKLSASNTYYMIKSYSIPLAKTVVEGGKYPISDKYIYQRSGTMENNSMRLSDALYIRDDRFTTLADWLSYVSNTDAEICYELATPTTIQTSAEEIATVSGTNIISGTEPISECKYTELATVDDLRKIIGGQ